MFPLMSGLDHLLMHIMQRDKAIIIIIIIIIIIAFWLLIQHINKLELNWIELLLLLLSSLLLASCSSYDGLP